MTQRPAFLGLLAALAAWTWMFLTVHYNYGGNWTALYLIGPRTPVPPSIPAERLYIFPNNSGYDGQSFHVMAHDPWMRRGTPASVEIENFRYARILVPALAWMVALGQDRWIDPGYYAVILAFVFLGVYWMAVYFKRVSEDSQGASLHVQDASLQAHGAPLQASLHPAWGLVFLLSPAALTSLDRMTVDIALAALCAAFVLYVDRGTRSNGNGARWKITLVLACALLTRETAWILFGAYEVFLLTRRRFADALFSATAALPLVAWHLYIVARAGAFARPPQLLAWMPLAGWFDRLTHPAVYDLPPSMATLAVAFDYVALCGMALSVAIAIRVFFLSTGAGKAATPSAFAICGFALAVVFLRGQGEWSDAFAFGRIFAPLLLLIAMFYMPSRSPRHLWLGLAPTLLVDSRIALNLGKQAVGVLRGLLHWA